MHSFYEQLETNLKLKNKDVLDPRDLAEGHLKQLLDEGFLELLPEDDVDGGEYFLKEYSEKFRLERRDTLFRCYPVDSINEVLNVQVQDANFYIINPNTIFQKLAEKNGFTFKGEYVLGSPHVYMIGVVEVGLKKLTWLYVTGASDEVSKALSYVKEKSNYVLVSTLDKVLSGYNDPFIHIVELPKEKPFGLKLKKLINVENGFTVEDFASLSSFIPVLIDHSTKTIYFYGRKVRDSGRDYLYVSTLLKFPSGLLSEALARHLSPVNDREVVSNDRRELKDALKKAFTFEPERYQRILDILCLNKMSKGALIKLNFTDGDIVVF